MRQPNGEAPHWQAGTGAEFLRSIRASQVMMAPFTAGDLDRMAELWRR
jgi:hypothetical protein